MTQMFRWKMKAFYVSNQSLRDLAFEVLLYSHFLLSLKSFVLFWSYYKIFNYRLTLLFEKRIDWKKVPVSWDGISVNLRKPKYVDSNMP